MENNPHWLPPSAPSGAGPATRRCRPRTPASAAGAFGEKPRKPLLKRIGGGLAVAGALIAKFAASSRRCCCAAQGQKLLASAGSALVSVAAWSLFFGWTFAVGFVVLLFVRTRWGT